MTWVLVLVGIFNGEVISENKGIHNSMAECFYSRDELIIEYFDVYTGYPPVNYQVVCIPTDKY